MGMKRVLLLGGPRHLDTIPCDESYPGELTTGNGSPTVGRYHRAVFRVPHTGPSIASFWFVYETDDYQGSSDELTLEQIHQKLVDEGIDPTNKAVEVANLVHERTIRDVTLP